MLVGTLTSGTVQQSVNILRRQTPNGESIEIGVTGEVGPLTWQDVEGARAAGSIPSEGQRTLIERLTLDSPDQFVLAQLRGASYYTVGRNVRDDAGGDDYYNGPLWDVIRVEEPETRGLGRPLSNWRLYYINVATGLIDKIVSELKGERMEAHLLEWVDQDGEKLPAQIVWKRDNETVQQFRLISFAIQPRQ